ncbi:hypothetical protein Tco_0630639 [Tanacetum coccineum]
MLLYHRTTLRLGIVTTDGAQHSKLENPLFSCFGQNLVTLEISSHSSDVKVNTPISTLENHSEPSLQMSPLLEGVEGLHRLTMILPIGSDSKQYVRRSNQEEADQAPAASLVKELKANSKQDDDGEKERKDKEDKEEEGSDLRLQTFSHFESTNDETYDEVNQGDNVKGEELDKEETNEEEEVNEITNVQAEVPIRSSNKAKTSHAVAANLSELELKKILINKMKNNKSIDISIQQKTLYKALVDVYETDKDILETYGDTVMFKRRRDDEG